LENTSAPSFAQGRRPGDYRLPCPTCARTRGDRRGDDSLSLTINPDGDSGVWHCWRCGDIGNWRGTRRSIGAPRITAAEIAARDAAAAEAGIRRQQAAAERAAARYAGARADPDPAHPYLAAKRIAAPAGVRQMVDLLMVPMREPEHGAIVNVQWIAPNGDKKFMRGARSAGCRFTIGRPASPDARVLICEGMATGATLHAALGHPVVVAFSADNLMPVALSVRDRFPQAEIVIAADNDRFTRSPIDNPGLTRGRAAAIAVGGLLMYPPDDMLGDSGTDFNDIADHGSIAGILAVPAAPVATVQSPPDSHAVTERTDEIIEITRSRDGVGAIHNTLANMVALLRVGGIDRRITYDQMRAEVAIDGRPYTDIDSLQILHRLQTEGTNRYAATSLTRERVDEAVTLLASLNPVDPVRDWIMSLSWDGTPRLCDAWRAFGCDENDFEREAIARFIMGIVARQLKPGTKFDQMIVLCGAQGLMKSTALRVLVGDDNFTTFGHDLSNEQVFFARTGGKVLVEFAELEAFRRTSLDSLKDVLSQVSDRTRKLYTNSDTVRPRRFVMAGTTNNPDFLSDTTGNRRFWPITCRRSLDLGWIGASREQLFAEARMQVEAGFEFWREPPTAEAVQRQHMQSDPWDEPIAEWLDDHNAISTVSIRMLLEDVIHMRRADMSRVDEMRVAGILLRHGWKKRKTMRGNEWRAPEAEE
jgi:putative DNA primase/helicase